MAATATGKPCSPVRTLIGDNDIKSAYKVQHLISQERLSDGKSLVGRKIGLTSLAVQKQLGVDQPDYGMLFNDMEVMHDGELEWKKCMQPKAEAEIAFVLKRDLNSEHLSMAQVMQAIDFAVPCIEIVGSRISNWDIKITDTIADNASASHYVLGHYPRKLKDIDLINCKMKLSCNGEVVSEGKGAACMGSPLNATWWLARVMAQLGQPLRNGDVVLAGALGPMYAATPGSRFEAAIEGLGTVAVNFGKEEV